MILFNPIRTRRLAVRLRELTMAEAIAVCRLPADRHEAVATEFLRCIAAGAETPTPAYVSDPRLMTVEERTLLVCHYLAQVSEGGPDFPVGKDGRFSSYVRFDDDLMRTTVDMGEVGGKKKVLHPLLGVHVEALEKVCTHRGEWLIGVLACQVHDADAQAPDYIAMGDAGVMEWCTARIKAIREMPESDVEELYAQYEMHRAQLRHFFVSGVDDEGIVFWPQPAAEEAGIKTPARFRAVPCISGFTRRLFG